MRIVSTLKFGGQTKMTTHRNRFRPRDRRGTSLVETAFVLPVFFTFIFAIIEFGHAQLVNNMLNNACRTAARIGSVEGTTTADVVSRVTQTMTPVIPASGVTVYVNDASIYDTSSTPPTTAEGIEGLPSMEVSDAEPRQMFVVRAKLNYNDIALVPMPFLSGVVLDSQAFMRHE